MNEKNGKKIILFLAICIPGALILAVITVAGVFLSRNLSKSNDFSDYREDFEIVEKIIMEDYQSNSHNYTYDGLVIYELTYCEDTGLYNCRYLYSDTILEINSEYTNCVSNIYSSYATLTSEKWRGYVTIRRNEFIFWNYETGYSQVIHSLNGQIPSGAIATDNYFRETNFDVLGKDWYVFSPKRNYR